MDQIRKEIVDGISKYCKDNNISKAVIGLSGGIDSSVTLFLTAQALGHENVVGISMPEEGLSADETIIYPTIIAEQLRIKFHIIPINTFIKTYKTLPWNHKLATMNTKARVRANILYHFANTHNAIVIGTSNKTEMLLGYFTKHGDGAVDIEPLGNLWKGEVIEIAKLLGVPKEIINRTPTAELYHGHTDEEELGGTYYDIDKILQEFELGNTEQELKYNNNPILVDKLLKRIRQNKHKTKLPKTL